MTIDTSNGTTKIIAEEGKKITNRERTIFSDFIYIAKSANIEDYEEVGREIWKHFIKEDNPDLELLKEIVSSLEEGQIFLEETLLDTDYRLLDLELEKEFEEGE